MTRYSVLACALFAAAQAAADPLPKTLADFGTLTVSGISSGAFMSVQFETAFSKDVRGGGHIAGGPFYCAQGSLITALDSCMNAIGDINLAALLQYVTDQASSGNIDDPRNLASHVDLLFSGTADTVVNPKTMQALAAMLGKLGVAKVTTLFDTPAEHGWITDFYGNDCGTLGSPFIQNCHLDFAGHMLQAFYSSQRRMLRTTPVPASFHEFDQTAFGAADAGLDTTGYVYIPARCRRAGAGAGVNTTCALHVNFHGCKQGRSFLQDTYVSHTEINMWAEGSGIVVLYPQVAPNTEKENPNGCWDWWGYQGGDYAVKSGPQMAAVYSMAKALAGGSGPTPPLPPVAPPSPQPPSPAPGPAPSPPSPSACDGKLPGLYCDGTDKLLVCPGGTETPCASGWHCQAIGPQWATCVL